MFWLIDALLLAGQLLAVMLYLNLLMLVTALISIEEVSRSVSSFSWLHKLSRVIGRLFDGSQGENMVPENQRGFGHL